METLRIAKIVCSIHFISFDNWLFDLITLEFLIFQFFFVLLFPISSFCASFSSVPFPCYLFFNLYISFSLIHNIAVFITNSSCSIRNRIFYNNIVSFCKYTWKFSLQLHYFLQLMFWSCLELLEYVKTCKSFCNSSKNWFLVLVKRNLAVALIWVEYVIFFISSRSSFFNC